MEKLYSISQAGRELGGISERTLRCWLSQGKLIRTKVGRRTMIAESELQRVSSPLAVLRRHRAASFVVSLADRSRRRRRLGSERTDHQ